MAEVLEALRSLYRKEDTEDDGNAGADDSSSEALSKEIFTNYKPSGVDRGLPHPGSIAEATSLSAIQLPSTSYPLYDSITDDIVNSGKLSQLQLESVMYACTKHLTFLPSGERAGFFIGDGAGVGKGRQLAGIILDNYARGRRQAVWLSTSSDLHHDAERDLKALGLHLQVINNCQTLDRETRVTGLAKSFQEGVLFMTYSTLISYNKGKTRLQQVIDWVGGPAFSGMLALDECHKAKNFVPGKEKQSTKVAAAVLELQRALPRARVVYCSATGVSEVQNMAYMGRLGLWGPGSAFPNFEAFLDSMKRRGVSFLEMLSMEMKSEGYYVARGLSFKDAEFMELECPLTPGQEEVYDEAVSFWKDLRIKLVDALSATNTTSKEVWKPFWSAQQRFFKLLCISMKVPMVVKEAQKALAEGCSIVLGLQTTGEAAADAMGLEPGQVCGFVSTTKEMLQRFLTKHFPTSYVPSPDESLMPQHQHPTEVESCVVANSILLQRIEQMQLPPNFLDELIDQLGGPNCVAEMTGRKARIVRNARGHGTYQMRAKPDSSEMDSLNVSETAMFMKGKKLVAIVSDAASTGISLHASADVENQRRRVHLTIELPWSADKAIQQLGRSHRSNQVSAPIFKLVLSNLGGERRFAAAVARRLQSLGALTRGDRRAASGIDLSESNLDSPLGRKSLKRMYDCIVLESTNLPAGVTLPAILEGCDKGEVAEVLRDIPDTGSILKEHLDATVQRLHARMKDCVDMMGIGLGQEKRRNDTVAENTTSEQPGTTSSKDLGDVRRFLNRLLGVEVARQNLLFNYFLTTLAAEVKAAKEEGRYSEGVSDLPVGIPEPPKPQVVWTDRHSGLQTLRTDLVTDRGISWEAACRKLEHERFSPDDQSGFRISRRPMFGRTMIVMAIQKSAKGNLFDICRPNTGISFFDMEVNELRQKYQRCADLEDAKDLWEEVYTLSKARCVHGANCQQGHNCTFGKRLVQVTILSGSIVRVWGVLESVLQRHEHMLNKADRTMRVVRVEFSSSGRLIGVRYPAILLPEVVAMLSTAQSMMIPAATIGQNEQPGQLSGEALQAASLGAGGAVCAEPISPVHYKSLAKAFRAPKTVLDFFKPKASSAGASAALTKGLKSGERHPASIEKLLSAKVSQSQSQKRIAQQANGGAISLSDSDTDGSPNKRQRLSHPEGAAVKASGIVAAKAKPFELANGKAYQQEEMGNISQDRTCHFDSADEQGSPAVESVGGEHERSCSMEFVGSKTEQDGMSHRGQVFAVKPEPWPSKDSRAASPSTAGCVTNAPNCKEGKEQVKRETCSAPLTEGHARLNTLAAHLDEQDSMAEPRKSKKCAGVKDEDVKALCALGFSREQAARALKNTDGTVERAANWLFQGT